MTLPGIDSFPLVIKCKEQTTVLIYMCTQIHKKYISESNIPFIDAREMPLLRITLTALFAIGVFREVLFMLFLLRGILGVTMAKGSWSVTASSAIGDGVLMRDTEKRPCTVGVCTPGVIALGVSTLFLEGDLPLAGDGLLDSGDFFAGDAALGEGVLDFDDFFAGDAALGVVVLDFGDFFAGDAALGEGVLDFGDFFAGVAALGDGDFDFGDFFPGLGVCSCKKTRSILNKIV